jgi:hypothetical protein
MIGTDYGDAWVCTDCYFAHHYGARQEETVVEVGWLEDEQRYGIRGANLWYAGEDDEPVGGWHEIRVNHALDHNREPLGLIEDDIEITDNTCSNHYYGQNCETDDDGNNVEPCEQCGSSDDENGIQDFSWSRCHGCGSPLGGSRYRLHLWKREEASA